MRKLTFLLACLFLIGVGLVNAQSRTVSGKVLSAEDGQPVIGATVIVKGTSSGTITGVDGDFSLSVPVSSKILVVSYVEVLVVAYGTTSKKSFTGAAATIKGDKLAKMQSSSVTKSLEGSIAGVQIASSTGQPGSDAAIRIRGLGSISASQAPLIVVDGVPYEGSLNSI
jgi:hypothetical protein